MDILVPAIYYLKNPFNHSKLVLNLAQFGGNIATIIVYLTYIKM
jgi:hypothetical protein